MNAMKVEIRSAMTGREAAVLRHLSKDRHVLELGSLLGFGTVTMAQVARKVTAVDPHDGYPLRAPRPTLQPFLSNLDRYGVRDRVFPIVAKFEDIDLPAADLAMIDLTGSYALTMRALESCRSPVLAVHDFGRTGCRGATIAVEQFAARHGRRIQVFDTLAVLS